MSCGAEDWLCQVSKLWATIGAFLNWLVSELVAFATIAWALMQPHTYFIAAVFSAAMALWKWYDRRDDVVFGRIDKLLGEQGQRVRQACAHAVGLVIRPTPSARPLQPSFEILPLLRVLKRNHIGSFLWQTSTRRAVTQLAKAHGQLDLKTKAANDYTRFVNEQRYATFMLEGALASAKGSRARDAATKARENRMALDRFIEAAKVPRRTPDMTARELTARHQWLCGQSGQAEANFQTLQAELLHQLMEDGFGSSRERDATASRLIRIVRNRAEIKHADENFTGANSVCIEIAGTAATPALPILNATLTDRDLLDRAEFHAFHCAVRVHLLTDGQCKIPPTGVARQSFDAAKSDYEKLLTDQRALHRASFFSLLFAGKASQIRNALIRDARKGIQTLHAMEQSATCGVCEAQRPEATRNT